MKKSFYNYNKHLRQCCCQGLIPPKSYRICINLVDVLALAMVWTLGPPAWLCLCLQQSSLTAGM